MVVLDYSWRQILVQAIYQILVLIVLMYFGGMIFFEESFNLVTAAKRDDLLNPMPRLELDTIIFHTFILMSLFNQINCRVVDSDELSDMNIFRTLITVDFKKGIFEVHFAFIIVLGFEFFIQNFMMIMSNNKLGSSLLGVAPITANQNLTCWLLGASTLLVNIILKKMPVSLFEFVNNNIDLELPDEKEWINVKMAELQNTKDWLYGFLVDDDDDQDDAF